MENNALIFGSNNEEPYNVHSAVRELIISINISRGRGWVHHLFIYMFISAGAMEW